MRAILTIGRFVALEARRTGMPWLFACAALAGIGLAGFLSQMALTESAALQVSVLAAFLRLCAIFMITTFVVTSMVRESNDKGIELLLSLPISRTQYFLGKLAGFIASGAAVCIAFSVFMLAWSPPSWVAAWLVSLLLEVSMMAAVSLFFVLALAQLVPALAASAGMYLLGRVVASVQAISSGPLQGEGGYLQRLASWGMDAVALLLPPLDRATQTSWLVYGPPPAIEYLPVLGAMLLYGILVSLAALFDFHRRNL
jgi:ABC-type transport system involved in multi-copper enzyme maturation permease subunit